MEMDRITRMALSLALGLMAAMALSSVAVAQRKPGGGPPPPPRRESSPTPRRHWDGGGWRGPGGWHGGHWHGGFSVILGNPYPPLYPWYGLGYPYAYPYASPYLYPPYLDDTPSTASQAAHDLGFRDGYTGAPMHYDRDVPGYRGRARSSYNAGYYRGQLEALRAAGDRGDQPAGPGGYAPPRTYRPPTQPPAPTAPAEPQGGQP